MSDQPTNPTGGEQAGQPGAPAQDGVSLDLFESLVEKIAARLSDKFFSREQSYVDKRLQKVAQPASNERPAPQPVPVPQPPAQAQAQSVTDSQPSNPYTYWAKQMEQAFGIELTLDDPEAELVVQGSPEAFKETYFLALKQKKARVGATSLIPATATTSGTVPAATPPTTTAGPTVTPTTAGGMGVPTSLEQEYHEKLKKIRRGDVMAVTQLQLEYRRKGAKV